MSTATKANGMNKPKRKQGTRQFGLADDAIITEGEIAKPKRYVPPEHSGCEALRAAAGKLDERYGEVNSTQTINTQKEIIITRYCYCRFCATNYQHVTTIKQ